MLRSATILFALSALALGMVSLSGCATSRYYHLPTLQFDQVDYGYAVHRAEVRNLEIGYVDEGPGSGSRTGSGSVSGSGIDSTPLLLVHGLGSNAKAWLRNIPEWSKTRRVIAIDLPGYGLSSKGDYPYSLSFYAEVLTEFLDELGIEKVHLGGHSLGGQIAMVTALQHPTRVENLILVAPAGFETFTRGEGQWFKSVMTVDLVKETTIQGIAENLNANFHRTPPEAEFMITDRIQIRGADGFEDYCYAVTRNVAAMIDEPVAKRLDDIEQPTLVIFGENDGLIPNPYLHGGYSADVAHLGVEALPHAQLVLIPDCGHFAQFEKPVEVNSAVTGFLGGSVGH
ncbi:MAG: alpha/beta fold hydrolase [Candidatus Eisenbacteria bacterium]